MNFKYGLVGRNEIYLTRLLNGHAVKDFFRLPRFMPPSSADVRRSCYIATNFLPAN
jgi:hypothetical protein